MTQIIKYNKSKDENQKGGSNNSGQIKIGNNQSSNQTVLPELEELWEKGNAPNSIIPKDSDNITEGEQSVAIGVETVTSNQGELATGIYNESTPLETLFSIGNGTDSSNRSNVLEVKKNNITNIKGNVNITGTTYSRIAVDSSYIHGFNIDADNAYKLGKFDEGQWIIEKDANKNLNIHTVLDTSLIIAPKNENMMVISSEKTKVNNLLDLTKDTTGTAVTMGTTKVEESNTNIKSVVENGFYFTDNNNNIAIGITGNYIQMGIDMGSPNFFSGLEGWRIQPDGTAEFQNLKVDGNLDVYVITYNEMRATNGILLVTDVGCVTDATETVISGEKYWIFTISEFPPFAIDDYVLLQYRAAETRIFQFKGIVTAIGADGENTVRVLPLSGFEGSGTSVDDRGVTTFSTVDPDTAEGQYLIRIGNKTDANRQTIIKLNPYDGGYIDFMRGLNSANKLADVDSTHGTLPTACRIGNLAGVTYKGTTLQGYGLFSDNAYLTGAIKNLNNTWSLNEDGSGQIANGHISWDASGNLSIKLGDTELTQYISNNVTGAYNSLKGYIDVSVAGLRSEFNQKIVDVSSDLHTNYTTTTVMNSLIEQSANGVTSTVTKIINDVSTNVNGKIDSVNSSLSSKITQTASSVTSDLQSWVNTSLGYYATKSLLTQTANSLTSNIQGWVNSSLGSYATKSLLTQTANSLTSNIQGWVNTSLGDYATKSLLTQTSNSLTSTIESWVNSSLGSYAKKSEITQNAYSIKLAVYDELKNKTGIDVQTGRIIIDADNTEFTGNIELKKSNDVLRVLDSNGQTVININNGYVSSTPQVSKNLIDLTPSYSKYSYGESINPQSFHYINNITKYKIGDFSISETIQFEDSDFSVRVASSVYENGIYDFPSYNYNDGGSYSMTIKFYQVSGSSTYTLYKETITNKRHFTTKSFSPSINGSVYADISVDFDPNRSKMTSKNMDRFISETLRFYIYKYPNNLTTIGRNGLSVTNSSDTYMSFTDEGLKIGVGDYALVANKTGGLAYNTKGANNTPIGCPIYINISGDSMMKNCSINNEGGTSAITVKGYEVDVKTVNMIHITGTTTNNLNWRNDTTYWIILPYAESAMVYIKNSSRKNMRIYSRGVGAGGNTYYTKNIYINQNVGTRNTGRYYFELEANNTETLILYATRDGWFNIRPIG